MKTLEKLIYLSLFIGVLFLSHSTQSQAQPQKEIVQVIVAPDHADWTYQLGEKPKFTITVLKFGVPVNQVNVHYQIGPEKMKPLEDKQITLKNGTTIIEVKSMKQPGFLRCTATVDIDNKQYKGSATAGFDVLNIQPTTTLPDDFNSFWEKGKQELGNISMKPSITLLPERCTDLVDVYHVGINSYKGKIFGILCKPKKEGKYPAILNVPGAGIRPYYGDVATAAKGVITFSIGIHGIPVNLAPEIYSALDNGALNGYSGFNLDDKNEYYFKRVFLGCIRSVDFIYSLPDFDGERIAVTGGSQGGALSIVTAALDPRIKYLAALYPAMCDMTGYLHERTGGWPHFFKNSFTNKPDKIETSKYYDVVNFARFVKVPGYYSWGFNDETCPPTSTYSAYNVITAPKELFIYQDLGHWSYPDQQEQRVNWVLKKLGVQP
ncbi:MAG: acetylxylan esterase [Bacteroidota bacterium]|nr:acetylxylan esterase [Bacteroidota bacterium]